MLKKIFTLSFAVLCSLALMELVSSCASPVCAELNCQNDGVCRDGFCQCNNGWVGAECTIKPNTLLPGLYRGVVKPGNGIAYHDSVLIVADTSTVDTVLMYFDFDDNPVLVRAQAVEDAKFSFESHNVQAFPASYIEGRGMLETNKLTLYFAYDKVGDSVLNCSFFGTRDEEGG